jgi:hypothetical protein
MSSNEALEEEAKIQKIILELNKAGLSYLKLRIKIETKFNCLKHFNTSKRQRRSLRRN